RPYYDAIGFALGKMADYLEETHSDDVAEREEEFRRLLGIGCEVYLIQQEDWECEMAWQAVRKQWPEWAKAILPEAFLRNAQLEDRLNEGRELESEMEELIIKQVKQPDKILSVWSQRERYFYDVIATALLQIEMKSKRSRQHKNNARQALALRRKVVPLSGI